ncbi:MAG: flagellar motor protein MotB [Clostridia bacterium]|nr:flagellar motor protein MotB [Clostridia bacterium]
MDKKPEECKAGAPEWMVTYGDLVTLLMCFFVLLFAFSEIDAQKFEAVMQSFQGSAGVLEGGKSLSQDPLVFDASPETDTSPQTTDSQPLDVVQEMIENMKDQLVEAIKEKFSGEEFEADVSIIFEGDKLIIRLDNNVLFDSAKADIKPEAVGILSILGETLQDDLFKGSEISIEGHTDNVPINTIQFPSNWELSGARAASVVKYFVSEFGFKQEELSIAGYAEFKPVDTNDTAEGRAKNRRVEIVVEKINFLNVTEEEGVTQQ